MSGYSTPVRNKRVKHAAVTTSKKSRAQAVDLVSQVMFAMLEVYPLEVSLFSFPAVSLGYWKSGS